MRHRAAFSKPENRRGTAMTTFLDHLFNIQNYSSRVEKDNARLIYGFTTILMIVFVLYALFVTQDNGSSTLLSEALDDTIALLALLSVIIIGVLTLIGVRMGRADLSAVGPAIMWYFSG